MKKKVISVVRLAASVLLPTLLVAVVVHAAGTLTAPSGSPAATSYTLDDIYTRLNTNASATAGNHSLSTTTSPAASFRTVSEIYSAIPTISAAAVATGTSYLGISGTLLGNIFNGTCSNGDDSGVACTELGASFTGGAQSAGGVDDFNGYYLGGAPASGRYTSTWTTCSAGNSYCGTGNTGASAKDNATGVIWSYPCDGVGCASWDTDSGSTLTDGCLPAGECAYLTSDTHYSWDVNGTNNDGKTAAELCSSHTGWSLPHQKQLMQAYIDGSYSSLEPQGVYRYYWSATAVSFNTTQHTTWVWLVNLSNGYTYDNRQDRERSVRCIR